MSVPAQSVADPLLGRSSTLNCVACSAKAGTAKPHTNAGSLTARMSEARPTTVLCVSGSPVEQLRGPTPPTETTSPVGLAPQLRFYQGRQAATPSRYVLEQLVFAVAGWVPTLLGIGLRGLLYRLIITMQGWAAIENGVRIRFASQVRLGHGAYFDRGVYLHTCPDGIDIGPGIIVMHGAVLHVYNFRGLLPQADIRVGRNSLIGEYCS
jgi:hypothetical protein